MKCGYLPYIVYWTYVWHTCILFIRIRICLLSYRHGWEDSITCQQGPPRHTNLQSHDKYWESTWETFNLHNLLIGVTNEQPGSFWQTKTHHLSHNQFMVKHLIFPIAISVHQRGPKHAKPIQIAIYTVLNLHNFILVFPTYPLCAGAKIQTSHSPKSQPGKDGELLRSQDLSFQKW